VADTIQKRLLPETGNCAAGVDTFSLLHGGVEAFCRRKSPRKHLRSDADYYWQANINVKKIREKTGICGRADKARFKCRNASLAAMHGLGKFN
jgi:hypothetical protein